MTDDLMFFNSLSWPLLKELEPVKVFTESYKWRCWELDLDNFGVRASDRIKAAS